MSYVPGFAHDLFVSYASEDRNWIQEFQGKLVEALLERGLEAEFWRDRDNIRFGQNWKEAMFQAVKDAALFLAILSPNYQQSDYCNDESDLFLDLRERGGDLKAGGQNLYRYLKIIKMPWDSDAHRGLLPELQDVEFFSRDSRKIDMPLSFTSAEFENRIRVAAHAIEATLKAMRRLREMVYVASPAEDVDADWRGLRAELGHQGYVVGPVAKLNRGMAGDFIRNEFRGSVLSIHLLGAQYHPLAERQIDLCAEAGQKMAVWIRKGSDETADPEQRRLIKAVRDFEKIPNTARLIEGATGRAPVHDLLELLKPAAAKAGRAEAAGPAIYLISDPTVEEDREFAARLEREIADKEKMRVLVPQKDSPGAHDRHKDMLSACDGVLLYRDKAPEPWFFQYLADVGRAEKMLKRPPMRSKAILTAEEDLGDLAVPASVKLLGRSDPFQMSVLEPFLAPLRAGSAGAHAGN